MNKQVLLPKLSVIGIMKNGTTYFPYMMAGIFSVFIFFSFSSIMYNDLMKTLPHSSYVMVLMATGLVLLGMILIPFLIYTNSFLIKRRKKELGLYSILGLEKKHIAIMMLWEALIIFGIVLTGGIIFGVIFSKLLFLILLNLTKMPVDTHFSFSFNAFKQSFLYFLFVYSINLLINWFVVFRSNPSELMKGAREGEKEPKRLWLKAVIGILTLAGGYYTASITKLDAMIFMNFFLAVALVIVGTHYFFTAGMITILKMLKCNKKFYYHKTNYVTLSGMLYRMKKSASSLANICIFSTMTIITLLCTLSLWSGTEGILNYRYPYDLVLNFNTTHFKGYDLLSEKLLSFSQNTNVGIKEQISFSYQKLHVTKEANRFIKVDKDNSLEERYVIKLITLDDFNQMEGKTEELEADEMIVLSTGGDFGYSNVILEQEEYKIKKELEESVFAKKDKKDTFGQELYFIVKDDSLLKKMQMAFESYETNDRIYTVRFQIDGDDDSRRAFINKLADWASEQDGFNGIQNGIFDRQETTVMYGGLLFIGIFFGVIFSMCLILIMYYKQITEGFEDRENFSIMQKVGMSDQEVRSTIKRQILMVFFIPLIVAILHTIAGFGIISTLLGTLQLFDTRLMITCGIVILILFTILYGLSYWMTSKSYYQIIKR